MPTVPRRRVRDEDDDRYDDDDRPRRSRSRDDDDEEEERPRRSRSRDDDEDEDRPRRSRRDRDDEDEDERPRRSRSRDDDDEDERPRRGRSRDRDDDDDEPKERGSIRSGWAGHKENQSKSATYAENLDVGKDPELIKFLEDEPPISYRQHWIDNPPNGIRKKSWTCLEVDCPLCDIGDRPSVKTVFNVVHLNTGGRPENKVLTLGVKAVNQLLGFAEDSKTGPLTKLYYVVKKTGTKQQSAFNFQPVKARDLEEDWKMEPLSDRDFDDFFDARYKESDIVQTQSRKQLRELAEGLTDDD